MIQLLVGVTRATTTSPVVATASKLAAFGAPFVQDTLLDTAKRLEADFTAEDDVEGVVVVAHRLGNGEFGGFEQFG